MQRTVLTLILSPSQSRPSHLPAGPQAVIQGALPQTFSSNLSPLSPLLLCLQTPPTPCVLSIFSPFPIANKHTFIICKVPSGTFSHENLPTRQAGRIVTPILEMRKLRLSEVHGLPMIWWHSWALNLATHRPVLSCLPLAHCCYTLCPLPPGFLPHHQIAITLNS